MASAFVFLGGVPLGYLAMLLRTLKPTDLESEREYDRAMRAAQLEYERLRRTGPECAHGEPAGHGPSPVKGIQIAVPTSRQRLMIRGASRQMQTPGLCQMAAVIARRRCHSGPGRFVRVDGDDDTVPANHLRWCS